MNIPHNWPVLDPLDKRLNLYDGRRANILLKNKVEAKEYLEARPARISSVFADLKSSPENDAGLSTQILHGEAVEVFAHENGHVWLQSIRDGYAGWALEDHVSFEPETPTHWITAPRTFIYPHPDMKSPRMAYRGMGSGIAVCEETRNRGTDYYILEDGTAVIKRHAASITSFAADFVSIAETLLRTPYLWGGATSFGIDCSGLVQLSMRMCGLEALRDSDMQAATIGKIIDMEDLENLRRGDLVFWRGHVGICQGRREGVQHLLHANGHTMDVTSEPLMQAIERIAHLYEAPIGVRRPDQLGLLASQ